MEANVKRLMILGIVTCVGLLYSSTLVAKDPQGPPGGLGVEIVNPLPVPVKGNVNATVSGDVNVTNIPDVKVVNEPVVKAKQDGEWIVNIDQPIYEVVQEVGTSVNSNVIFDIYDVPDGYRLVIEYVSIGLYCEGWGIKDFWKADIITTVNGDQLNHFLNIPAVFDYEIEGFPKSGCTGGQVIKIYADPLTKVRAVFAWNKSDGAGWVQGICKISGRLINIQ
jgi:hypothetical protein